MIAEIMFAVLVAVLTVSASVVLEAACRRTTQLARTVVFNTAFALLNGVWSTLLQPFAEAESAFVRRHFGIAPIPLPDHGWRILFSAAVVMFTGDLIFYWVHRAQHRYSCLWAMHSFHHSDDDLNVTTSSRHFWFEKPAWMLVFYVPLGLIFAISPSVAAAYGLMFAFFATFPHMNIRLEMGPLTRVILGPQVHRIHHSVYSDHFNTNFAGAFPLWDLVFGTYRAPGRGEFPPTGVPTMASLPTPLHAFLWPIYRSQPQRAAGPKQNPQQS